MTPATSLPVICAEALESQTPYWPPTTASCRSAMSRVFSTCQRERVVAADARAATEKDQALGLRLI